MQDVEDEHKDRDRDGYSHSDVDPDLHDEAKEPAADDDENQDSATDEENEDEEDEDEFALDHNQHELKLFPESVVVSVSLLVSILMALAYTVGSLSRDWVSTFCSAMKTVVPGFSQSVHKLRKQFGCHFFESLVQCRKCSAVYRPSSIWSGNSTMVSTCQTKQFPHHRSPAMRGVCGEVLAHVVGVSPRLRLHPHIQLPIMSLSRRLAVIMNRPKKFCVDLLRHAIDRRKRLPEAGGYLFDIYDGKSFVEAKEFWNDSEGAPLTVGLGIFYDKFQPFSNIQYSVGCLFGVILNLPRHIRYSLHNLLILQITPDGQELNIDNLVDDLTKLSSARTFEVDQGRSQVQVIISNDAMVLIMIVTDLCMNNDVMIIVITHYRCDCSNHSFYVIVNYYCLVGYREARVSWW